MLHRRDNATLMSQNGTRRHVKLTAYFQLTTMSEHQNELQVNIAFFEMRRVLPRPATGPVNDVTVIT